MFTCINEISGIALKYIFDLIVLQLTLKSQGYTVQNASSTLIIQANNRCHYICVKFDNVFWSFPDLSLYVASYYYYYCTFSSSMWDHRNPLQSTELAVHMIHVRNFGILNTYSLGNGCGGDQFLQ